MLFRLFLPPWRDRYDELTADEIVAKLAELSQIDLATVDAYERAHDDRSTIRTRIRAQP